MAAIGADNPDKSEIAPELLASSKVVVDLLAQCSTMGDLHHAIEAGCMTPQDIHAELGEIVAGRKPGRSNNDEVIVFDSTGVAILDAVCAIAIYRPPLRAASGRASASEPHE